MWVLISQRNIAWKHGYRCDLLENNYVRYLEKHGICSVAVPNVSILVEGYLSDFSNIRGIVLSGGNDINPFEYGGKSRENLDISVERDEAEKKLLAFAVEKRIPLLGICRGMQLINVFFGGGLVQRLDSIGLDNKAHVGNHEIEITDRVLIDTFATDRIEVNSFHNQAVTSELLSRNLKIFAKDPNSSVIEGLFHPQYPIVGIQYHPERGDMDDRYNALLLDAFKNRKLFWG